MSTACFDPTLGSGVKGYLNSVDEYFVLLCTNPCPPLIACLTKQGCSTSTGGLVTLWFQQHLACVYKWFVKIKSFL